MRKEKPRKVGDSDFATLRKLIQQICPGAHGTSEVAFEDVRWSFLKECERKSDGLYQVETLCSNNHSVHQPEMYSPNDGDPAAILLIDAIVSSHWASDIILITAIVGAEAASSRGGSGGQTQRYLQPTPATRPMTVAMDGAITTGATDTRRETCALDSPLCLHESISQASQSTSLTQHRKYARIFPATSKSSGRKY